MSKRTKAKIDLEGAMPIGEQRVGLATQTITATVAPYTKSTVVLEEQRAVRKERTVKYKTEREERKEAKLELEKFVVQIVPPVRDTSTHAWIVFKGSDIEKKLQELTKNVKIGTEVVAGTITGSVPMFLSPPQWDSKIKEKVVSSLTAAMPD